MEQRLAEYRARKRTEDLLPSLFSKAHILKQSQVSTITESEEEKLIYPDEKENTASSPPQNHILHRSTLINSDAQLIDEPQDSVSNLSWFTVATYILYFLLWATLYAIAINLEFGTVYFIISLIYFLWKNTRTEPKKAGEVSAYSVFNPNCGAIDGTLNADQFEREIRFGALSVH